MPLWSDLALSLRARPSNTKLSETNLSGRQIFGPCSLYRWPNFVIDISNRLCHRFSPIIFPAPPSVNKSLALPSLHHTLHLSQESKRKLPNNGSISKKKPCSGCVCVCVWRCQNKVNALLTAHKLLLADGEHVPALHQQWVGAAGVDTGQEVLLRHPDRKPLQLAVAQQAGSVQSSWRWEGGVRQILSSIIYHFRGLMNKTLNFWQRWSWNRFYPGRKNQRCIWMAEPYNMGCVRNCILYSK